MHCPRCGQQQISDQTKFCSRCGFQLGLVSELSREWRLFCRSSPSLINAEARSSPERTA
jgi:hypothetical protein